MFRFLGYVTITKIIGFSVPGKHHHHHHYHHHHLALQPFVDFRLLSQVSPSSSILSCLLPVFDFQLFLDLLAIVVLFFLLVWFP
jgi:hypothetical protein